ncbi:hypothetical protein RFI_03138 [Reticulomyxa filosa]|uniref:Uncharacterized protein n=1 Tax=Reticulomyxa filosa TaxID=46433 RepID=X6P7C5_RETFI|nr:hypothetical protein RFI_03138 [Reticulomyxa filosa]|eukprot:ETO33959.1 hypothetical protein RFI_03138 [Reticulomyxa filosa]
MSLMVGYEGHYIYLGLCKILGSVLVRVDNRWMKTVPFNKSHSVNEHGLIQPYLIAYFKSNGSNLDESKEWLKRYIKRATILKDSDSNDSMKHLYCSSNNLPCEGSVESIVKDCPYCSIQTDAQNCYLRSHNVGYRIRLDSVIYEWFRDQESFVFKKRNYNAIFKENIMKSGNKSNECVPYQLKLSVTQS